jgi:hypothetical protein
MELITNRKIGIEMEGYLDDYPKSIEIAGVSIGQDGSLENYEWEDDLEPYGVELRTKPMTDLFPLYETWKDMQHCGWGTDDRAGTHIHVDISDFTGLDKVKLLRFGKGIEKIIFLFVEDYRIGNDYCCDISKGWRSIFRKNSKVKGIDWNNAPSDSYELQTYLNNYARSIKGKDSHGYYRHAIWNGKYQWMNVLGSNYSTVEYRLFHAVGGVEELIGQAMMSLAIVNLVKNSTVEQLEFILKEIYSQETIGNICNKFFEALGMEQYIEPYRNSAYRYLENKLDEVKIEAVV